MLIFLPLILDILFDGISVDSYCPDKVATTPEGFFTKSLFLLGEGVVYHDSTLALEKSHHMGNGVFGRNGEHHVNMVGACSSLDELNALPFRKFSKDFADLHTNISIENFLSVFGCDHNVVDTIPDDMVLRFERT